MIDLTTAGGEECGALGICSTGRRKSGFQGFFVRTKLTSFSHSVLCHLCLNHHREWTWYLVSMPSVKVVFTKICSECEKSFGRAGNLERQIVTHSNTIQHTLVTTARCYLLKIVLCKRARSPTVESKPTNAPRTPSIVRKK